MGSLIEKKQSRQKPPPSNKPKVNGDANSNNKESKLSKNAPSTTKPTLGTIKKDNQKFSAKDEPPNRPSNYKENGNTTSARPAQERLTNEKLVKTTQRIDNDVNGGIKPPLKNSTTRQQTNITKSNKESPKTQKLLPAEANMNGRAQNSDYMDVASVPPEDPNIDFDLKQDPLLNNGEPESDTFVRLDNRAKRGSIDNLRNVCMNYHDV